MRRIARDQCFTIVDRDCVAADKLRCVLRCLELTRLLDFFDAFLEGLLRLLAGGMILVLEQRFLDVLDVAIHRVV